MILAYALSSNPTPQEAEAAAEAAGGAAGDVVRWRNGNLWRGEVEEGCTKVLAHREDIRLAYATRGAKAVPFEERKLRLEEYGPGYWRILRGEKEIQKGRGPESKKEAAARHGLTV